MEQVQNWNLIMNDIKELQETITNLEKEKDILQEEIAKDMVKNSDLIIQNQI